MIDCLTIAVSPASYEAFVSLRVSSWCAAAEKIITAVSSNYSRGLTAKDAAHFACQMAFVADNEETTRWSKLLSMGYCEKSIRLIAQAADCVLAGGHNPPDE